MRYRMLVLATLLVALAGCRAAKPAPPAPPPPRVTVIKPATAPVREYWVYNGYLDATKAVDVKSKIRGFLAKKEFTEGTEVAVGDPLYKLDKLEFETAQRRATAELAKSEAQIKSWEAQIIKAKADLERVNKAVASGAESKTEQDKAQAALEVNIAERDAAIAHRDASAAALKTAEIQVGYTDIRAKIAGRISRTHVDEGNLVLADSTLLTTIVSVDKLYVYYDAPETDFIDYQKMLLQSPNPDSNSQSVPIEIGVGDEVGYPHIGHIDFRENRVETATGTIRVRGQLDNPLLANKVRLLFPGMYARVRVPRSAPVERTVVPEDCLVSGQEGRSLLVVSASGMVEKRIVTVGATVWKAPPPEPGKSPPSWVAVNPKPEPPEGKPPPPTRRTIKSVVAITAGLKPDDRVILDGLQHARPGTPVTPEDWVLTPPAETKK